MGRLRCARCELWYDCPTFSAACSYRCGRCQEILYEAAAPPGGPAAPEVALGAWAPAASVEQPAPSDVQTLAGDAPTLAADVRRSADGTGVPGGGTRAGPHDPADPAHPVASARSDVTFVGPDAAAEAAARLAAGPTGSETLGPGVPAAAPAARAGMPPGSFGRYDLLDEVGRGGMGVVYRARQREINRIVALKVLLAGAIAADPEIARFRREAAAAASLSHPGIVAVHDVGVENGQHYFTMDFVEGRSLGRAIHEAGPFPAAESLRILRAVCEAVAHAHARGIVHRDLKPDNILLRPDGRPVVTDFGLAKPLADTQHLTASGVLLGTLVYMSPEQASGELGEVGPLSDVYSLGAVLYELLTGRPPFEGTNTVALLAHVILDDPVPPKRLRPGLSSDVQTMCLTAMAKDPRRRYPSAQAFADDIGRFLAGESVVARPAGAVEKMLRRLRKHRGVTVTAGIAVALLALAIGVFTALPGRLTFRVRAEDPAALGQWRPAADLPPCDVEIRPGGPARPLDPALALSLAPGRYALRFRAPGYEPVERTVEVAASAALEVPVDLQLTKGTVALRLSHDLPAAPEAEVTLRDARARVFRFAPGEKRLALPVGKYVMDVGGEGFVPIVGAPAVVRANAETAVPVPLRALERWRVAWPLAKQFGPPAVADLEGDGRLEIVLGTASGLLCFAGISGTWLGSPVLLRGHMAAPAAFADVDGDGLLDAVVTSFDRSPDEGRVFVVSGKEGHPVLWSVKLHARLCSAPALGDVDGDGTPDVVVQGHGGAGKIVCLGGKAGRVLWQFPVDPDEGYGGDSGPVLADLEGDGRLSVVAADTQGGCVALDARTGTQRWVRTGGLRLSRGGVRVANPEGAPPAEVFVTGGDGRGRPALACLSGRDGKPRWVCPAPGTLVGRPAGLGTGAGARPDVVCVTAAGMVLRADGADGRIVWQAEVKGPVVAGPAVGPLDDGGVPGIVIASQEGLLTALSSSGRRLWTYRGEGEGTTTPAIADLEGDGTPDVIATFSGNIRCVFGSRRLLWSRKLPGRIGDVGVADSDGDGLADVWAYVEHDHLYCLSGRDGEPLWDHLAPVKEAHFAFGRFCADGPPCAVVGYGGVQVLRGEPGLAPAGRPLWQAALPRGGNDPWPAVGDVDGDGVLDVACADRLGAVYVVSGRDRKLLWPVARPALGAIEHGPVLADVDRDGFLDLVVAGKAGQVCILSGKTGAPLWPPVDVGHACAHAPAVGDWNGDGVPDVVVTTENRLTFFLSGKDGRPLRPPHEGRRDPYRPHDQDHGVPVLADLNGDGVLDAVLTPGGEALYLLDGKSGEAREVILAGGGCTGVAVAGRAAGRAAGAGGSDAAGGVGGAGARGGCDAIVVGCLGGRVYALTPAGRILWWFVAGDAIEGAPVVGDLDADGVPEVLVASKDRKVYCLSLRTGLGGK